PADLSLPRWSTIEKSRYFARRDGYVQPWAVLFTALALAVLAVIRRVQTDEDMWAGLAKVAAKGSAELPAGSLEQPTVIHPNWFVAMIAVMALVVMAQRMRGYAFNPWFAPVIVLTAWLGSVLAERGQVPMSAVVGVVAVVSFFACRTARPSSAADPRVDQVDQVDRVDRPW